MIQKIKLKNFQSLKDVTFNLGRVTVLRGKSDVGKSAVIRGLNAFFNNSFNSEYAHNGELPFGVAIQKDNKVALGRRTAKGVEYKFDSTVYSKTAKKIPQDISNFLGIYPYAIDVDMSVFFQIQKQFDQPFLLTDSSITVAKIIGRISNLNIVLMAMREMYASQLEVKQEVNFLYSRKKEIKNSLLKFSNFDEYESLFKRAESLESEILDLEERIQKIFDIVSMGDNYNSRVHKFKSASTEVSKVNSILEGLLDYFSFREICDSIEEVDSKLEINRSNKNDGHDLVENLIDRVVLYESLSEVYNSLAKICHSDFSIVDSLSLLEGIDFEKVDALASLVKRGAEFNTKVKSYKDSLKDFNLLEEEYDSLYSEFTKGKVICPFSKLEMQEFCKKNLMQ